MKKDKLVKQMDNDIWNSFVCYCKNQGKNVADALADLMKKSIGKK